MEGHDWPACGVLLADRYRLIDLCGVGGMSAVWRADDLLLDRPVAVKALAGPYAGDIRLRTRIMREARAAARLSHPNITTVYDYGEAVRSNGAVIPFVVMELLDGPSLEQRLDSGPLPWPEAVEICARVAEALARLHEHGVVHRDVTPGNIICTPTGIKILDFGISALVGEADDDDATGITFGTVEYVAPERLDGAPASGATDVFALGVLLYELVSGHAPFPAESWDELATVYDKQEPVPRPPAPAPMDALCERCLSMDAAERPSAAAVAALLDAAITESLVVPARAESLVGPVRAESLVGPVRTESVVVPVRTESVVVPVPHRVPADRRGRPATGAPLARAPHSPRAHCAASAVTGNGDHRDRAGRPRDRRAALHHGPSGQPATHHPRQPRGGATADPAHAHQQPIPGPTPVGTAPAPVPPSASATATNGPSLARPPPRSVTPAPPDEVASAPIPPEQAVDDVHLLVSEGAARNEIRQDVADDIINLIGDLERAVASRVASEIARNVDRLARRSRPAVARAPSRAIWPAGSRSH